MLTLFADTDCDMTPQIAAKYGYRLISMPYSIDGETIYPYETWEEFDSSSFYGKLRAGTLPTTSAVSEAKYIEYFEPEFSKGNDILYVHFSEAMSGTFSNMRKALEVLKQKYPERKFYEIDTKGISAISLYILEEIGEMFNSGKSLEDVLEWAKTEIQHYAVYFFADDLKFFRRSGRVSGLAATMGGLIGLRPVIYMSPEGKMESIGTEKGRVKVMERLVDYVAELSDDIKGNRIIIAHTDALAWAEQMEEMLRKRFGEDIKVNKIVVNPTAGAHCGPNVLAIAFHVKHR